MKNHNTPQPLGLTPNKPEPTLLKQYDDCCEAIRSARAGYWKPTEKEMNDLLAKRQELNAKLF